MVDIAIGTIRTQDARKISFAWVRRTFMRNHDLKDQLAYGHAVIDTVPKLDQYLWTYGPMIESQWQQVANVLATIDAPERLIDYGCGQGLAGLLIDEITAGRLLGSVKQVLLVEPSALALARAEAIYGKICPNAKVTTLCKRFDDVVQTDVPAGRDGPTLHIFSNSLDVLGFDPDTLLANTLQPGQNTIVSISHDRSFDGGTPRIEATKAALEASAGDRIIRSTLESFTCTSARKPEGVIWLCELEIDDG